MNRVRFTSGSAFRTLSALMREDITNHPTLRLGWVTNFPWAAPPRGISASVGRPWWPVPGIRESSRKTSGCGLGSSSPPRGGQVGDRSAAGKSPSSKGPCHPDRTANGPEGRLQMHGGRLAYRLLHYSLSAASHPVSRCIALCAAVIHTACYISAVCDVCCRVKSSTVLTMNHLGMRTSARSPAPFARCVA
jgi:hypothetical protein